MINPNFYLSLLLKNSKNLKRLVLNKVYTGRIHSNFKGNCTDNSILDHQFLKGILLSCNNNLKILEFDEWKISISDLKLLLIQRELSLKKLKCIIYNGKSYNVECLIQKYKKFNNNRILSNSKIDTWDFDHCHRVTIEWA